MFDRVLGTLVEQYSVRLELTGTDLENKTTFVQGLQSAAGLLREPEVTLESIPQLSATYQVLIKDSEGHMERWCVSQRLGITPGSQVPQEVHHAISVRVKTIAAPGLYFLFRFKHIPLVRGLLMYITCTAKF